jgi:hypothetical protein
MDKVTREDIESCIQFIREDVEALRQRNPHLERAEINFIGAVPVPHPWERPLRVADALERILRGEDANKALGLVAPEGAAPNIATHMRRAKALWPHILGGCSLEEAIDKLKEDKDARADDVSFDSYRNSLRLCQKQLMSDTFSDWIDDTLTPVERAV